MDEFKKMLVEKLPQYLKNDRKVKIEVVRKVNKTEEALMLVKKEDESPFVTPSCSVEHLYEEYKTFDNDELFLQRVAKLFQENFKNGESLASQLQSFTKEDILNRVVPVLMPTNKNTEILEILISRPFLDLTLAYCLILMEEEGETGSCMITKPFAIAAGISEEELFNHAISNAKRNGYRFQNINALLNRFVEGFDEHFAEQILDSPSPLSVLTNRSGIKGAGLICCPDILEEISSFYQGDFYIVPCSMHEIITLQKHDVNETELKQIIEIINRTELQEPDVLSDSLYCYNSANKMVEIVF